MSVIAWHVLVRPHLELNTQPWIRPVTLRMSTHSFLCHSAKSHSVECCCRAVMNLKVARNDISTVSWPVLLLSKTNNLHTFQLMLMLSEFFSSSLEARQNKLEHFSLSAFQPWLKFAAKARSRPHNTLFSVYLTNGADKLGCLFLTSLSSPAQCNTPAYCG